MVSDMSRIDNQGNGFRDAVNETKKVAQYRGAKPQDSTQLQLIAEEMLSLARSVTGEMQASFWLECEESRYELHLTTKTVMDKEKRYQLIASSTSRKNEAARSFLGKLRDAFESAMASDVERTYYELPSDIRSDVSGAVSDGQEWDGYERSVLRNISDDIRIAIRGGLVEMTVTKDFGA